MLLLASACANPLESVRGDYLEGRYADARASLDELVADGGGDVHLRLMERAVVDLAVGDPEAAVAALRAARDRCDDLSGRGIGETTAAWLVDDRLYDYEGTVYEQVAVRALLSVAELMAGRVFGDDARAYALQVLEHQRELVGRLTSAADELGGERLVGDEDAFRPVVFGSYLWAILNEENPLNRSEAARYFRQVRELQPSFAPAATLVERAEAGRFAPPGRGVVHVVGLVGLSPARVETNAGATDRALSLAKLIWGIHRERFVLPEIRAVPIAELACHRDNPTDLSVEVDGLARGATVTITDVEDLARREFSAQRDAMIARAIVRRAIKIAVTEASKEGLRRANRGRDPDTRLLGDVLTSIGGALWTAFEAADLRSWSLLPAAIQVGRLELPAGEHEMVIRARRDGTVTGAPQTVRVAVREGRASYVLVIAPSTAGGPPPLTSSLPRPIPTDP